MRFLKIVAVASIVLGSCAPPASPEVQAERDMIIEAKWRIEKDARNPDSVETRNMHIGSIEYLGFKVVCGEMNGENAFGGMTGFRRFVMFDGKVPLIDTPTRGLDVFEETWVKAGC